jgi:hypothetical protein
LRGLEILGHSKIEEKPTSEQIAFTELKNNLEKIIVDFTKSISDIERVSPLLNIKTIEALVIL